MFPNPQDALPLPARPSLERYKKLAKELVTACKSARPGAILEWSEKWVEALVRLSGVKFTQNLPVQTQRSIDEVEEFARRKMSSGAHKCALTDAQFVIARSHGFKSWPKLARHLQELEGSTHVSRFEAAADAIVSGDIAALKRLMKEAPELVRARSTREHGATLLHYVSANGVEGYRQKTPKNIVHVAKLLLDAGAEVDATCYVYGGDCTTLGLAATSVHPAKAGVQEQLLQLFLDHGALIEKPNLAGNRHSAVIACLANGQLRAAKFLAVRGAHLDLEGAAGIGRVDLVRTYFHSNGSLKPRATKKQLQSGFLWACVYGHEGVAEFLLEHGANPLDPANTGATALHWAAGGGHVGIIKLLLDRGARLEEINMWGGTVLEHAGWGFEHSAPGTDFVRTFEMLLVAGAKIRGRWLAWIENVKDRSDQEKACIAEIFRRHHATA